MPDDEFEHRPSKSQRKREVEALQDLGTELTRLSVDQLRQIELPEDLRNAVLEAKRITKNGAIRRQMQYIGKLMRNVDPAPIQASLDAWRGVSHTHNAWLHGLERWRERLLADEAALTELAQAHPGANLQRLRTLIRNARQERAAASPPKHFRELFQALRELIPEPASNRP
ncbi:MAG: ribosome biogenesis factor YjgA [Pseudomonadota bacterium]